ncbi:hypothetical protein AAE478_005854 [Parahypoxylon ruwenzoriense]
MDHPVDRPTNPEESAKRRAKIRASIDNSVNRLTDDINTTVGGPPADDASREDWDRYLNNFMGEMNRRDYERAENSWIQLAKAEKFVKQMGKKTFRMVGDDKEENASSGELASTRPALQRDRSGRSQATQRKNLGADTPGNLGIATDARPPKRSLEMEQTGENERQATFTPDKAAAALAALATTPQPKNKDGGVGLPSQNTPPPPKKAPGSRDSLPPKKKRRSGVENLEVNLGVKWDVQVDEQGHRPARGARRCN